jgi:hypothetical protein
MLLRIVGAFMQYFIDGYQRHVSIRPESAQWWQHFSTSALVAP